MTIDIDQKQIPKDITEDFEVKTSDKVISQPDDEYSLKCKLCTKNMLLQLHNIHTTALLFQFYTCKCPVVDTHIIVRDKRINESVIYRSEGIWTVYSAYIRYHILGLIVDVSEAACKGIILLTGAPSDLIVDQHLITEYAIRRDDAADDARRYADSAAASGVDANMRQSIDSGDITAVKHLILYGGTFITCCEFDKWLNRLAFDSFASMIRSAISYMVEVYVRLIANDELNDFRMLIDMILYVSNFTDDLCSKVIDLKYTVPDAAKDESFEIINMRYDGNSLKSAQFKHLIQRFIYLHLMNTDDTLQSMSCNAQISTIDKYAFTSNLIDTRLSKIAVEIVHVMRCRINCSSEIAR